VQPPSLPAYFLSLDSQKLLASLDLTEPQTFEQAVSHSGCQAAMQKELHALSDTNTWCTISLPQGKKPIAINGYTKSNGSIERLKARLVGKGFI